MACARLCPSTLSGDPLHHNVANAAYWVLGTHSRRPDKLVPLSTIARSPSLGVGHAQSCEAQPGLAFRGEGVGDGDPRGPEIHNSGVVSLRAIHSRHLSGYLTRPSLTAFAQQPASQALCPLQWSQVTPTEIAAGGGKGRRQRRKACPDLSQSPEARKGYSGTPEGEEEGSGTAC